MHNWSKNLNFNAKNVKFEVYLDLKIENQSNFTFRKIDKMFFRVDGFTFCKNWSIKKWIKIENLVCM